MRLLRLGHTAVDHLVAIRDYDTVDHDRLCQAGDEGVARLVVVG